MTPEEREWFRSMTYEKPRLWLLPQDYVLKEGETVRPIWVYMGGRWVESTNTKAVWQGETFRGIIQKYEPW